MRLGPAGGRPGTASLHSQSGLDQRQLAFQRIDTRAFGFQRHDFPPRDRQSKDANLFATAASAKWSLAVLWKAHPKLRIAIEAMKAGDNVELRSVAEEILTKNTRLIQEETASILKAQRQQGIW